MYGSTLWSESRYIARCLAALLFSLLFSLPRKDHHTPPVPPTLTHLVFRNTSSHPDLYTALSHIPPNLIFQLSLPNLPKSHTIFSVMTSATDSIVLPLPIMPESRARELCDSLTGTLGAESIKHHEDGNLETAWSTPSIAYIEPREFGFAPGLADGTSQPERVDKVSQDEQTHLSQELDPSGTASEPVVYGKMVCALGVRDDKTDTLCSYIYKQDLNGVWSGMAETPSFLGKDGSLFVQHREGSMRFLPGDTQTVTGKDGKWRTTSIVSPAPHSPRSTFAHSWVSPRSSYDTSGTKGYQPRSLL